MEKLPETEETEEGLIKTKIEGSGRRMVTWSVYNSGNVEKYMKHWSKQEELQENDTIIGGNFNIRIGEGGGLVGTQGSTREQDKRISKDRVCGSGGSKLILLRIGSMVDTKWNF